MAKDGNSESDRGKSDNKSNRQVSKGSWLGICLVILLVTLGLLIAGIVIIPSPIEPVAFGHPEPLPTLEGPLAPNEELRKAQQLYEGQATAPESIEIDSSGVVYSGLADGRIVKFVDGKVVEVARTGTANQNCGSLEVVHICGRPLGMRFDTSTGTVSTLVSSKVGAHGEPFQFVNDLDIDCHGTIYFTDSIAKWDLRNHKLSILEGDATGRLMAYHKTGELDVLLDDLQFANGVQISHEGDSILVAETTAARICRLKDFFTIRKSFHDLESSISFPVLL